MGTRPGVRVEEHELVRHPRLGAAVREAEARGRTTRAPRPLPGALPSSSSSPSSSDAPPDLEAAFLTQLRRVASYLPEPRRNYQFAIGSSPACPRPRKWALDFAWPLERVAVEVDGGVGRKGLIDPKRRGRHVRPDGFESDAVKRNTAQCMGWVVLVITGRMLHRDPAGFIHLVALAIAQRRSGVAAHGSRA